MTAARTALGVWAALFCMAVPAAADWTTLLPGPGARIVYVSASSGSDSNSGLTEATPKATIAAGFALLRGGQGDHLLLKRGDTFALAATLVWNKGGASVQYPMVFGAYGSGPRPVIDPGSVEALHVTPGFQSADTLRHLAIVGLHFKSAQRDFTQPGFDINTVIPGRLGIRIVGVQTTAPQIVEDLLIEDCKLEFLGQGIVLEGPYFDSARDVRLRRNVIVDIYVTNGDTNGVYASNVRGLLMEENLIDGIQRAPGLPAALVTSSLSHTVYVQSTSRDVTLRNNIFARAFDGGMMRPGGAYEGNLAADVMIGTHQGYMFSASAPIITEGIETRVTGNAFVEVGANQAVQAGNLRTALVDRNLMLSGASTGGRGLSLIGETALGQVGVHSLVIEHNFILGLQGLNAYGASISDVSLRNNQFRASTGSIVDLLNYEQGDYTFAGSAYRSEAPANQWFRVNQSAYYDLAGWTALVGESGATSAPFIDPASAPNVESYHASIGGAPTLTAFLAEARQQSRQNWRESYTAVAVVGYLRQQFSAAPVFTMQPANQTIPIGGTIAQFTASASANLPPSIQWQVSTDFGQNWTNLTNTAPYSGATTATLTLTNPPKTFDGYRYRAVATNLSGRTESQAAILTIVQMKATPTALKFAATKNGASGNLVAVTPGQIVTVSFSGTTSTWSTTVDQPWVQITGGSGSGNGRFTVSIVNPNDVLGASTHVSATITITPGSGSLSPVMIPVTLTITQSTTTTAAPIGQVDTPAQNAANVVGAIGVTGWVIDDIGIESVRLYRTCLAAEPQAACSTAIVPGQSLVFVGDAVLVNGARPDIEAAFPSYPATHLAGWGLQVLTNMLPRTTGTYAAYGGQGPMTFYAVARDIDGHQTVLGRAYTGDTTPTSITADNDNIAKPFGTIDTPGQGATVSGTLANFGWALTPDTNATAESGDVLIPTDGSTMFVFVDGAVAGNVAYNQCRGTVGNPVPGGQYCNDDVANVFGNVAPQPTFTARTSNPTKFRNLDAGRAAIGAYAINSTTLPNGLHTIAWSVTDSAGRVEGIGSRLFTVLNGSLVGSETVTAIAEAAATAPAIARGSADAIARLALAADAIVGRAGFDLRRPLEPIARSHDGIATVVIPASGRLELELGPVDAGYLVANGTLRDLPPGSRLDAGGAFTWTPAPGYLGTYRLAFIKGDAQIPVDVTLQPEPGPAQEHPIRMYIDLPEPDAVVRGAVTVAGWSFDAQAFTGTGIGAVHVWARRTDIAGAPAQFLGTADLQGSRPDVGLAFGAQFAGAGFGLTATLAPGTYDITAYAWCLRTGRFEDARAVRITIR